MGKKFRKCVISVDFTDDRHIDLLNGSLVITTISRPYLGRHAVVSKNGNIVFDPMVGEVDVKITYDMNPLYLLIVSIM